MADLTDALRKIAAVEPDMPLGALNKHVGTLQALGLLRVCECSDGDYVKLTDKGRKALESTDGA